MFDGFGEVEIDIVVDHQTTLEIILFMWRGHGDDFGRCLLLSLFNELVQ